MIHPGNHRFKNSVDYRTHHLTDTSKKHDRIVSTCIGKMEMHMTVQMKPYTFNPFHSISVIGLLKIFKLSCDTIDVHEGAAMWLFYFVMNKIASVVLNANLSADGRDTKHSRSATRKTK